MLDWRAIIVPLSGPAVKFGLYFVNLFLSEVFKVGSFRVVLPDESIHILIAVTLPAAVGIGEVDCGIGLLLNRLILGKLSTTVVGYGTKRGLVSLGQPQRLFGYLGSTKA